MILEENVFFDNGFTGRINSLWDTCDPEYDYFLSGVKAEATIGMWLRDPSGSEKFISEQVEVELPAATDEQKAAISYVEPTDPDFKAECEDYDFSGIELLLRYQEGVEEGERRA